MPSTDRVPTDDRRDFGEEVRESMLAGVAEQRGRRRARRIRAVAVCAILLVGAAVALRRIPPRTPEVAVLPPAPMRERTAPRVERIRGTELRLGLIEHVSSTEPSRVVRLGEDELLEAIPSDLPVAYLHGTEGEPPLLLVLE